MITVSFPALNNALTKDVKDLPENDPRRGIIVLNNNAIVLQNNFCIVCDLYEYFTIESGVEDPEELEELDKILFWMDGKIFSSEFWKEITKGANMKMNEGNLYVENPKYSKDLHHKEIPIDLLEPLKKLQDISKQPEDLISAIAIPFGSLQKIYSCLASEFKNDIIIFEFNRQDSLVKFTFRKRKHFYGYIKPHYDSVQEGFRFESLNNFITAIGSYIEQLEEEAKQTVPEPPPIDVEPSKSVDDGQLKLVED
jgi:hypothetical protein